MPTLRPRAPSRKAAICLAALLAALFVAGTLLAPLLRARGKPSGSWLGLAYRPLCHQIGERSFGLQGQPLAVCARCEGLYVGGWVGLVIVAVTGWQFRRGLFWLIAVATPNLLDVAAGNLGLPSAANWPRFAMAVPVGVVAGVLLAEGLTVFLERGWRPEPATDTRIVLARALEVRVSEARLD